MADISVASMPLSPACTRHQPVISSATSGAKASTSRPTAATAAPMTVHGWRRPNREHVRSDSSPTAGLTIRATTAPAPITMPSTNSLFTWSSSSACCGSSTWIGA
jgi:hypothetical protein